MTNKRKHSRTQLPVEVSIHCDNGSVYRGVVKNISMSGINISIIKIHDMGYCENGLLKMRCGSKEDPLIAEFSGKIIRCEQDSLVYQLRQSDPVSFKRLKKIILHHADDPHGLLKEMRYSSDFSLNYLYMPAMRESIRYLIHQAVESVFRVYFDRTVQSLPACPTDTSDKLKITSLCGFNGSIFGNVILVAEVPLARGLVGKLLEQHVSAVDMPHVIDGFGELCNMIAGGIQSGLSEEYENISLIPPVIFIGDHCSYSSDQLYSVKTHFQCNLGPFVVECLFSVV
ncbi:MAG: chemotaxis protein CheX [Magnetococcales bacterium]|nr:chemotaxis protein CheX [Magnetococcales bacterium]